MTTWTPTARAALQLSLDRHRARYAADGAEADEVIADLRDHVEREAASLNLSVVTETDVRRILAQVDPRLLEIPTLPLPISTTPSQTQAHTPSAEGRSGKSWLWLIIRAFLGVLLPLGTLILECIERPSASELVDPIPTPFHILLIAWVPVTHALGLWFLERSTQPLPRWFAWMLSASLGISGAYAVTYAPITPLAAFGILFYGVGLIPLAPLIAWVFGLQLRSACRKRAQASSVAWPRHTWTAAAGSLLILAVLALPEFFTARALRDAIDAEEPSDRRTAIRWLRKWGTEEAVLRACYGTRRQMWDNALDPFENRKSRPFTVTPEAAQAVYFQVTGRAFNEVRPPLGSLRGVGRQMFEDFEWDRSVGGEAVAGHVSGLSLQSSRLDVTSNADDGWGYTEWILEFRNDHASRQREARAEIQLPPGGVVSRLTLWVYGEEREAAFAGRGEVRAAYQQVAVAQRRDPVLVTTSGPDRVLMQCFPVPPKGGTLKVRLGITAPLTPLGAQEVAFAWPRIVERNFALNETLKHLVWLESPQKILNPPSAWGWNSTGTNHLTAIIPFHWGPHAFPTLKLQRKADANSPWSIDDRSTPHATVRQAISSVTNLSRGRLAVVVDGGRDGRDGWEALRQYLASTPARGDLRLWAYEDGIRDAATINEGPFKAAIEQMERNTPRFEGGHDPLPALEAAWGWASQQAGGTVLWIHGNVPVLLGDPQSMTQRLQRGEATGARLVDLQITAGPHVAAKEWSAQTLYESLPRLGTLDDDLKRFLDTWTGLTPEWHWHRERSENGNTNGPIASRHLVRLWARDQINQLRRQRKTPEAVALAGLWQLVTPVSGAVVLETKAQYKATGLTPVDPLTTPAIVPEPETWGLMIVGTAALALWQRRQKRRH
jgi:hypothetical protein